jgi:tetratricopeptide (TPR) repeat protein
VRPGDGAGGGTISERADEVQALYDSGDTERALSLAIASLDDGAGDDPTLLRLAAQCALDLGRPGAAGFLRRVVAADPGAAGAAVDLAHVRVMEGSADEALGVLEQAAAASPGDRAVVRALVDVNRAAGRAAEARRWASALADDGGVAALLDVAELSMAVEDFEGAATAFLRMRAADRDEGHERYACHGAVEALARAGEWRRALDLAVDATRLDRHQLTTDLLAYVVAQLFGPNDERPAPAWDDRKSVV